mmetsp:Transcript_87965/g.262324  ORF Transcript_87965/g.262324 Transcript_87965/m.262324 type:complete len:278 (-) Transcript_87965:350-1183(-)
MGEPQDPRDGSSLAQRGLVRQSGAVEDDRDMAPAILEDVCATFRLFDADASGAIDPKEIRLQMQGLGFEADNTTIYTFINDLDSDGSLTIEFEEFLSLMKDHLRIHEPEYNALENITELFNFIDDPDPVKRSGRIDSSCLRWMAGALGDEISDEDIEAMVKCADSSGKGYVDIEDFHSLMVRGASLATRRSSRRRSSEASRRRSSRGSQRSSLTTESRRRRSLYASSRGSMDLGHSAGTHPRPDTFMSLASCSDDGGSPRAALAAVVTEQSAAGPPN